MLISTEKFKIPVCVILNRLLKDPSGSKKLEVSVILVIKMKQGEMKFLLI